MQDYAESHGLKIDRTLGPKHKHMTSDEWQLHQENERKEKELTIRENDINSQITDINKSVAILNDR